MSTPSLVAIVDDEAPIRAALNSLVRVLGYQAVEFDCAEAFLASAAYNHSQCQCLIVDVQMPGMSGLELLDKLKNEANPLPVIIISAHFESKTKQKPDGALCMLSKPFSAEQMIACLDEALSA
ncbi:response regulator transcription factor [Gallaecimonas pentaromativorans]|uniref:response regulator transcription factor n=1 Tax=Gallaecimonas pentaromativorans TaxID=584787 RepID=UPI003A8DE915